MCLIESRSQIWRVRLATEKVHWSNITNCKEPRAPTESSRNYTRSQSTNAKEILETTTVKHDTYHKATQTPSICKEFLSLHSFPSSSSFNSSVAPSLSRDSVPKKKMKSCYICRPISSEFAINCQYLQSKWPIQYKKFL